MKIGLSRIRKMVGVPVPPFVQGRAMTSVFNLTASPTDNFLVPLRPN